MEKEKESFLQGESFQDVDPKFAESRLVPLLDQLFELIKLEFSHTLNSVKRMDLFDGMYKIIKDFERLGWLKVELRRAARGYFDERTKDAIKKAFLTSSEPVNVLYDELLAIERLIKENAETLKKKK